MMQTQDIRLSLAIPGELLITKEKVVESVLLQIKLRGLDKAIERFDVLDSMFRRIDGWNETYIAVQEIFLTERERQQGHQLIVDNRTVNITGDNTTYNEILKKAY